MLDSTPADSIADGWTSLHGTSPPSNSQNNIVEPVDALTMGEEERTNHRVRLILSMAQGESPWERRRCLCMARRGTAANLLLGGVTATLALVMCSNFQDSCASGF